MALSEFFSWGLVEVVNLKISDVILQVQMLFESLEEVNYF